MNAQASWQTTAQQEPRLWLTRGWVITLAYTLFVILFGAVVRITGSGAGCGQHWPTCQGEIAPLPHSLEMLIEFTHRLTSGLSMLVLFGLTAWTFRWLPSGHVSRKFAAWSCGFMILEAAIGARLVLLGLVGQNDTAPRAVIMALHLLNTSALVLVMLGALRGLGLAAGQGLGLRWERVQAPWIVGVLLLLGISATGAVTALGDTLYPVAVGDSALSVVTHGSDASLHFLERLRSLHPLLALAGSGYLGLTAWRMDLRDRLRGVLIWLLAIQLSAGVLNIALSAPGLLQVLHLALANLLWLAWCWAWFERARPTLSARPLVTRDRSLRTS